jgi:hypothetical protein
VRAEFATTFNANGSVSVAVTDKTTHNYLKSLLLELQMNVAPSVGVLPLGLPDNFVIDGVIFIADKFMPTGSNSKRILFLDTRYIFMAVLKELTYEEKASENDSNVYILKEYLALVMTHQASSSQMYGIA